MKQACRTRQPSQGVAALARVNTKKGESGAHAVFKKYGQSLPIKLSRTNLPTMSKYPYVRFTTWLRYVSTRDQMDQLVGNGRDAGQAHSVLGLVVL